jgi:hypothetical protein
MCLKVDGPQVKSGKFAELGFSGACLAPRVVGGRFFRGRNQLLKWRRSAIGAARLASLSG